ncbi:DUF6289 family protein [Sphingomonas pseudosanguinis]|uniref:Uncharacterized protein n=1 Tax=Sphingomonas pseudosanguinis TaxID=413712 RepID=A0A7W6A9E9_9SPHN|nr:DUF6289 family protein [Sphingomonas pseudosanguinis]MBB3878003.1 hypothetical protein [Sphingomonas pseudosanguinis]MBN3537874.1 hypothetical protein [Sphingomonas pseudosanguinis]
MRKLKLAILATIAISATAAAQYDDYHYVKQYYSDGSRTRVVGQETFYCSGEIETSGTTSPYYRYFNGMCP